MKFNFLEISKQPITACKQYCLAAGATQGNIAYTQNVRCKFNKNKNQEGLREPKG
jgi:hypothetical protein